MLGNEAGIERNQQAHGLVGQIELGPVVGTDEPPVCAGQAVAVTVDDLVYAARVGEEPGGLPVVVNIGH